VAFRLLNGTHYAALEIYLHNHHRRQRPARNPNPSTRPAPRQEAPPPPSPSTTFVFHISLDLSVEEVKNQFVACFEAFTKFKAPVRVQFENLKTPKRPIEAVTREEFTQRKEARIVNISPDDYAQFLAFKKFAAAPIDPRAAETD
jgi:hypothetical protein